MEPDAIFQERSSSWYHGLANFWWNHRVSQTRTKFHEEPETQVQQVFICLANSARGPLGHLGLRETKNLISFGSNQIREFLQISHSWLPYNSLNGRRTQQIHSNERVERTSLWLPTIHAWYSRDKQHRCGSRTEPPAHERLTNLSNKPGYDERTPLA